MRAGRWCFLPAIPFVRFSDWKIPEKPMRDLATAVRKVSRVLWALHVTFQEVRPGPVPPCIILPCWLYCLLQGWPDGRGHATFLAFPIKLSEGQHCGEHTACSLQAQRSANLPASWLRTWPILRLIPGDEL